MMTNSDDAIRRALQILAGMTGGYNRLDTGENPVPPEGGPVTPPANPPPSGGGAMSQAAQQAAAMAGGGGSGTSGRNSGVSMGAGGLPPQLEALMNMMLMRMQYQEPLFRSVTQQAMSGLPKYAQMRDVPIS